MDYVNVTNPALARPGTGYIFYNSIGTKKLKLIIGRRGNMTASSVLEFNGLRSLNGKNHW